MLTCILCAMYNNVKSSVKISRAIWKNSDYEIIPYLLAMLCHAWCMWMAWLPDDTWLVQGSQDPSKGGGKMSSIRQSRRGGGLTQFSPLPSAIGHMCMLDFDVLCFSLNGTYLCPLPKMFVSRGWGHCMKISCSYVVTLLESVILYHGG